METRSRKRLKLYETLKKNPKYKLRKLSVGVVSFLTGFAVLYGGSVTVSAQEVANQDKRVLEELVNEIKEPNAPDMVDISTEEPKVYGESQETVDTDETTETSINENTFNENKEEDKHVMPFIDVPANIWYRNAVQYVYENGIMSGTSDITFSPDMATTRGMIVTILYRLEGMPKTGTANGLL